MSSFIFVFLLGLVSACNYSEQPGSVTSTDKSKPIESENEAGEGYLVSPPPTIAMPTMGSPLSPLSTPSMHPPLPTPSIRFWCIAEVWTSIPDPNGGYYPVEWFAFRNAFSGLTLSEAKTKCEQYLGLPLGSYKRCSCHSVNL